MNNNTFSFSDLLNESSGTIDNMNITNLTVDTLVGNTATIATGIISNLNGITASINTIIGITGTINNLNVVGISGNTATFGDLILPNLVVSDFVGIDTTKRLVSKGITGTLNRINISYGSAGITLSTPQDINTTSNPTFNTLNLTNSINQNISGSKGFVIGNIGTNTPNGYAGICHQSLATNFNNSCLQTNSGGDVIYNALAGKILVFAQGGVHKFRVWNNQPPFGYDGQCEVVSDNDYVSSANSALRVNGGIYCGKSIFAGNKLITDNIESNTTTLNIGCTNTTQTLNLACSNSIQALNIGIGNTATTTINIGGPNDVVSIGGTLTYINTTDLKVSDREIFLNSSGTTITSYGSGLIIETQNGNTYGGWIRQDTVNGNKWSFKNTNNAFTLETPILTTNSNFVITSGDQTITGLKTFNGGITGNTMTIGGLTATLLNLPSVTANQILATDANRNVIGGGFTASDITRLSQPQTVTGLKTFTGGISGSTLTVGGLTANNIASPTFNVIGATASRYAFIDANRNIISVNDPTTNLLTSSNTWSNINKFDSAVRMTTLPTFINPTVLLGLSSNDVCRVDNFSTVALDGLTLNNITLNSSTASRILTTNGSKVLTSGSFGESEIVRTTTNQIIGGDKTFSNNISVGGDITVQNSSNWSRLNLVAGNITNNRALLYLQSFGATGQALSMFADATSFILFNNNTSRTIWSCPKTTDVMNFEQGCIFKGVSDASNSSSGYVGEYVESIITGITCNTSITRQNATSISLTAGDWDVQLMAVIEVGNSTNAIEYGISDNATATSYTDRSYGDNCAYVQQTAPIAEFAITLNVNSYRVNINSTKTYYAKFLCDFAGATKPKINKSRMSARRVR
jgi:hypothetical protein